MSMSRTSDVPSAMEGLVLIRLVIPKRCAMSATVRVPTSWASRTETVFSDQVSAWFKVTVPE